MDFTVVNLNKSCSEQLNNSFSLYILGILAGEDLDRLK